MVCGVPHGTVPWPMVTAFPVFHQMSVWSNNIWDTVMMSQYTLDGSHRTVTTEVVQAIKSVEENIKDNKEKKIWDQTMYL